MTHTITRVEEWEEEICDNCGHPVSYHYDEPKPIMGIHSAPMYIAVGCMVLNREDGRILEGNPLPRCKCLHSV